MTTPYLVITLLGEFSISENGKPINFSGDRPISLLTYLLLNRSIPVSRQQLAFTLWPDSTDSQARTNLRNLLHTLRQALPQSDSYLSIETTTLQWRPEVDISLDEADFVAELAVTKETDEPKDKIAHLETAVSLYKGDLLPGNYDDWIMPLREELRQHYLDALHQLIALLEQQQAYRAAARYSQRLLLHDPLDERAYVQLMRLHALGGDRAGLRRIYETCVATLRRELDVEPSPATQAAYEQLLRLETPTTSMFVTPSLEAITSSPVSTSPRPLPQPLTPFIGREAELGYVAEVLANPACRLLTIIGSGGMGKTRLALETAVGHQRVFADGVIWVPLMPVQTVDQMVTAVADALRHRLRGTGQAATELIRVLHNKEMLLVLDNFEHLMEATTFLTDLLMESTAIKVLVTSQQALALQPEWRFELGEMPLPDEKDLEALSNNSAVILFEQSARRVTGTLALTAEDYADIARICRLVGGIPLGIELAASWTRLISCAEIAEEIEKSLDFLTVDLQDIPVRHRSLRAVFDYSWQLLSMAEQQALAQLSLFRGGFTREAAAQVAGANLPLLSALTDRSLVQRMLTSRYGLHSLIRQYAHGLLQTDQDSLQTAAQRHSDYFLQWLANKESALRSQGQKEALLDINFELANIRIAWQQAVNTRQFSLLRSAAYALSYFYELRDSLPEAEATFRMTADQLEHAPDATSHNARLTVKQMRTYQAYFGARLGQATAVIKWLKPVIADLQELGDERVLAYGLRYLGLAQYINGNYDEALETFQQSLALAKRLNRQWEIATTQASITLVLHDKGDIDQAQPYAKAALANSRALGDLRLIGFCLILAGRSDLELNQLDHASEKLEKSVAIGEETNDLHIINRAYLTLSLLRQAQGDIAAARLLLRKSMDLLAQVNDQVGAERISVNLGLLEMDVGNLEAAKPLFLSLLQVPQQPPRHMITAVTNLAIIRHQEGDPFTALVWILFILQQLELDDRRRQDAETIRAELESELSAAEIDAAQTQADQLTLEDIVIEASYT